MHLTAAHRRIAVGVLLTAAAWGCAPAAELTAPASGVTAVPTIGNDPGVNPPTAFLGVEGGDPVPGALGSFQWGDVGSAAPWLPGTPITAGAGEIATISVDPNLAIASWRARAAAEPDGSLANGISSGGPPVSFGVPGPGEWTIEVTVQFAGGSDSASYYWRMTVQ